MHGTFNKAPKSHFWIYGMPYRYSWPICYHHTVCCALVKLCCCVRKFSEVECHIILGGHGWMGSLGLYLEDNNVAWGTGSQFPFICPECLKTAKVGGCGRMSFFPQLSQLPWHHIVMLLEWYSVQASRYPLSNLELWYMAVLDAYVISPLQQSNRSNFHPWSC